MTGHDAHAVPGSSGTPTLWSGFLPIIRGLVAAAIAFAGGVLLVAVARAATGTDVVDVELMVTVGYVLAVPAWLLGVGLWRFWGRDWVGLPVAHAPTDWRRYLTFCEDHKVIGLQYLATFVALLLVGGLAALLMRLHLVDPSGGVMGPDLYNRVMSFHGITMIAVAVAAVLGSFGNYLVPLMIGARDMAFPRLNALTFWLVPMVVLGLLGSQLIGGWDTGWTGYPPLSVRNAPGQVLFNLSVIVFGLSSILGALNLIVTIVRLRAPGMAWGRLPIFVWSVLAASIIALFFTQFFAASLLMVLLDRVAGTAFFAADAGGQPLLYQHVFWFYSHPAVYIFVLPGFGMALEILAHLSRRPLFAYRWVVAAFFGIVGIGAIVWAHHMFTSGMPDSLLAPFMATTELVSIPTGIVFLSALGTIWQGRLWLVTPMLFALGFVFNFVIGGVTGIFLADVPTDIGLQDTYFVVAHFHYTIIGGEIFALLAAFYYWFPKMTGRMLDERLGKLHFWWVFIFFNATFIPMFWVGLQGMNRRIASYPEGLGPANTLISVMSLLLGLAFVPFVVNIGRSLLSRAAQRAPASPWHARTLEWLVPSPPPVENFATPPIVLSGPYAYGGTGMPHAAFAAAGASDDQVPSTAVRP